MRTTNFRLRLLMIIIFIAFLLSAAGCGTASTQNPPSKNTHERLKICTTFYPLYDFTKKIAEDKADVSMLVPAGVEPHDFEPSPKKMSEMYGQDMFIYLGETMEPWGAKMAVQLGEKGITIVEAGNGLIKDGDPHIWLDPNLAQKMARKIYEALSSEDEANAASYQKNYEELSQKLQELDRRYAESLKNVKNKNIVTSHAAFGYMAARYGFNQISITGISPLEEPSPRKMAELTQMCRAKGIKYVFFETLASPKLAEALAGEAGTGTLVLNPIGGLTPEEVDSGEDYFSIMDKNLVNLVKAMNE